MAGVGIIAVGAVIVFMRFASGLNQAITSYPAQPDLL